MYTQTSTLLRIFDRPEILATSSNNFPDNSCFGREHNLDTLERRDLLNLQEDDAIANNAHNRHPETRKGVVNDKMLRGVENIMSHAY